MKLGCVLLAAGAGRRFGGGKLLHKIDGEPMIARAMRLYASNFFAARICVTRAEALEIQKFAYGCGFPVAINPDPDRGVGTSVAIGTEVILAREPKLDGILYAVADQPYLTRESIQRLVGAFEACPTQIVSLCAGEMRGNPAIFPAEFYPDLCALKGDTGGGAVIRKHPERVQLVEVFAARELEDIDINETGTVARQSEGDAGKEETT